MHFSTFILAALAYIAPAIAATHDVTVTDKGFEPTTLCINARDEVHWRFAAGGHNIEAATVVGSCTSSNTWRTNRVMQQGWDWNRRFDAEATIGYMSSAGNDCANGFKGVIYVGQSNCKANDPQAPTPAPGPAGFNPGPGSPSTNSNSNEQTDSSTATNNHGNGANSQQVSRAVSAIAVAAVVAAVALY